MARWASGSVQRAGTAGTRVRSRATAAAAADAAAGTSAAANGAKEMPPDRSAKDDVVDEARGPEPGGDGEERRAARPGPAPPASRRRPARRSPGAPAARRRRPPGRPTGSPRRRARRPPSALGRRRGPGGAPAPPRAPPARGGRCASSAPARRARGRSGRGRRSVRARSVAIRAMTGAAGRPSSRSRRGRAGPGRRGPRRRSRRRRSAPGAPLPRARARAMGPRPACRSRPGRRPRLSGGHTRSTPSAAHVARSLASLRGYCARSAGSPNWRGLTKMETATVAHSTARGRSASDGRRAASPWWGPGRAGGERGPAPRRARRATGRPAGRGPDESRIASAPAVTGRGRAGSPRRRCPRSRTVGDGASQDLVEDRLVHPARLPVPGNAPASTSARYAAAAARIVPRRSAYGRAWRGTKDPRPSTSVMTWICPAQPAPAPIPMVGMRRRAVIAAASCSGTSSRTTAKAPASWTASASWSERSRLLAALALHPDLAQRVDGLRGEADVAHHRDPGLDQRLDDPGRAGRRPRP